MTASPSAAPEPTLGPADQAALSLLTFGRGPDADRTRWARLVRQARCADSGLDADRWFPVSVDAERAAGEAADALAVCRSCPVRSLCLALSLLHWDVGQYGVWGGLVAADRARLRRQMLAPRPEGAAGPQHDDALSLLPLASYGPGRHDGQLGRPEPARCAVGPARSG